MSKHTANINCELCEGLLLKSKRKLRQPEIDALKEEWRKLNANNAGIVIIPRRVNYES